MGLAIALSLVACFCTATASVCQRLGARNLERSAAKSGAFALSRSDLITAEPAVPPPPHTP